MPTNNIIQHLVDGNLSVAKTETEALLYSKLHDVLDLVTKEVAPETYKEAVGMFGLVEKKKTKLDAVGSEDGDIDNDDDSDESDDYLKNRRNVVGFAIRKRKGQKEEK